MTTFTGYSRLSSPESFRTIKGTQLDMSQIIGLLTFNGTAKVTIDGEECIFLGISREDGSGKSFLLKYYDSKNQPQTKYIRAIPA